MYIYTHFSRSNRWGHPAAWPGHPPPSSTVPGGPATRAVDPVELEGESLNTKGPFFSKGFSRFFTLRNDERRSQGALVVNFD
jgi:hypothetical protein